MNVFDFYESLESLLKQIPNGKISTPLLLAEAIGDRTAHRAVRKAIDSVFLKKYASKIDQDKSSINVFKDFETNHPLRRLADMQRDYASKIISEDSFDSTELIAGVDASYFNGRGHAVCVVMDRRLNMVEVASIDDNVDFPYIPGYLAFREGPLIKKVSNKVTKFNILLVNGHGVAHPRGCGLASHVGFELDIPTVGFARRLLVGSKGFGARNYSPIFIENRIIGAEVPFGASNFYISVGHRISLETGIEIVKRMSRDGVPEPLRLAHKMARERLKRRV